MRTIIIKITHKDFDCHHLRLSFDHPLCSMRFGPSSRQIMKNQFLLNTGCLKIFWFALYCFNNWRLVCTSNLMYLFVEHTPANPKLKHLVANMHHCNFSGQYFLEDKTFGIGFAPLCSPKKDLLFDVQTQLVIS